MPPVKKKSKTEEAYKLQQGSVRAYKCTVGQHSIIRGDCLSVLRKMEDKTADIFITSPPYNLGIAYNSYKDKKGEEEYLNWLEEICIEIKRVMKDNASFFLNIAGSSSNPWLPFELVVRLRKIFILQNHIEWIKSVSIGNDSYGHFKPVVSNRFLHRNHENIFHFTKTGNVKVNRLKVGVPYKDKSNIARRSHQDDLRCRGDVWFIPYDTVRKKSEKFNHPGTFPLLLPQMCIRLHGVEKPVVIDPFMGVGTTLLATHYEGGKAIGIDIDKNYVKIVKERIKEIC